MKKFREENLDLQGLEFCIVDVHRADPALLDMDAKDAVDALAPPLPCRRRGAAHTAGTVQTAHGYCEWRLGRPSLPDPPVSGQVIPVSTPVKAWREIQKSIPFWTRRAGRKGYLDFVSP